MSPEQEMAFARYKMLALTSDALAVVSGVATTKECVLPVPDGG